MISLVIVCTIVGLVVYGVVSFIRLKEREYDTREKLFHIKERESWSKEE